MATAIQGTWQKRIDNSRLVRERDPSYVREWAGLLLAALICLGVVLVWSWQQFERVQIGYQIEELRQRQEQVSEWNRTLRLEHATLTDPMRIDAWARNRLGLETPRAGQLIPAGLEGPAIEAPVWARVKVAVNPAGAGAGSD